MFFEFRKSFLFLLLMIHALLLVVKSFEIQCLRLVGSDNRSRSSFPQRLFSVKDGISLLLIASSNRLNCLFMLGVVRIR